MDRLASLGGYKRISKEYAHEIDELYSYYKKVILFLMKQGLDYEDAQDAVQDTYIEAISYLPTLRNTECLKSWLFTIAKRIGSRYISKQKTRRDAEENIEEQEFDKNLALAISSEENIDEALGISQNALLGKNLLKLEQRERRILVLHYVCEYEYDSIAKLLDLNHSTVRSISRRAKEKLRRFMVLERDQD